MITHVVRIGFAGECFLAAAENRLSPKARVLVRTPRGVELGEVLSSGDLAGENPTQSTESSTPAEPLSILREVTRDDQRLMERLTRHKVRAVRRCQKVLAESHSKAVLIDVDQLFDGGTLILHFLGTPDELDRELTDTILREYEAEVKSIELSDLLENGCGPNCGTEPGAGCGGHCAGCAIATTGGKVGCG